ncbi:MAG: hypothetical protein AB1626_02755 [Candidatus Micrarchaeota archaeon]
MPRTRPYPSYARWHPRFVEAYSHLHALREDRPLLNPRTESVLTRVYDDMASEGRLSEKDRCRVRDILRSLGRKMPRAFVGRVSRGEVFYEQTHPTFKEAERGIIGLYKQFAHASTPPLLRPDHASLLRDIWDTMNYRGKIYESQRQTLLRVLAEMRRE